LHFGCFPTLTLHGLIPISGKIVIGGETDSAENFIAPTVVQDVPFDDALMTE
jgi:hypothetical protein